MIRMLVEMLVIVALAVAVGLVFNSRRPDPKKRINLTKAYFDFGPVRPPPEPGVTPPTVGADGQVTSAPVPPAQKPKHGWQVISYEDVVALVNDPNTEAGGNMLVDARKVEDYEKGHIPWAIRILPYTAGEELPTYLERLMEADKIVVYCGGGQCEDSIFMCRELDSAGIPYAKLFLYEGGYHEWVDQQQPTHQGSEP